MSRTTLSDIIQTVQGMTDATYGQYTMGTVNYWDSDQVQKVLDRHRHDIYREDLAVIADYVGGSVQYLEYQSRYGNFESTNGGTAVFFIEDGLGDNVGTASYSVDYPRGRVTFTTNTQGTAYYLTGRSYDLNATAAEIWRHKASHYAVAIDVSLDGNSMKRSQLMQHCLTMADYYDQRGGPMVSTLYRSDINDGALT